MSERGNKAQRHRKTVLRQDKQGCHHGLQSEGPPTRRRRSQTGPVAAYNLVPLTSEQGSANKKWRRLLAFLFILACFENITFLTDYMVIILKDCQGASGIIII